MIALLLLIQEPATVYRVGRLIPVASEEIRGAWISVEGGKIKAFGPLPPPEGARVVDLGEAVCMPGLVDAGTPADVLPAPNEESSEITPDLRALRLLDPSAHGLRRLRRDGVTTYAVSPGSRNVIGGLTGVVKLRDGTVEAMTLREEAALHAAMGRDPAMGNFSPRFGTPTLYARRPTTRMGVAYEFRRAFLKAAERSPDPDPAAAVLVRCLDKKLPVRVSARRATDIETALQLAAELGLTVQIDGGQEAHLRIELLAARKVPVIFRPTVGTDRVRGAEDSDVRLTTFGRLVGAGLAVAIVGQGTEESEGARAMAARLVRAGADRAAALKALTLWPAELLGVADRVGAIAPGRDADLLFLSGDPLQMTSDVIGVLIDGTPVDGFLTKP